MGRRGKMFEVARETTGLDITLQTLRKWFAEELGRLEVADRYIDAFCGRILRSVLARHYMDYSMEKLKEVYEKAGLKVLKLIKGHV